MNQQVKQSKNYKKPTTIKSLVFFLIIIITALISGGIIYFSFNNESQTQINYFEKQLSQNLKLQQKSLGLQNQISSIDDNNKIILDTKEDIKKAFYKKYPNWENKNLNVSIDTNIDKYAIGNFEFEGGNGVWFAAKNTNDWTLVTFSYIGYFGVCQDFNKYNFPIEIIPDCWDTEKKILIDTSNPEKFYLNGLTRDDKNKLKDAFITYIKNKTGNSDYLDKEFFVYVRKNTEKHLKGMILVGGIENRSVPYFLAVKINNNWKIIHHGQDIPLCNAIKPYNFPNTMVPECWDEKNQDIKVY